MTINFHFSSIVYEIIRTISSLFIFFFFYEKIVSVNKASNAKQTMFTLLEVFVPRKIIVSIVFCLFNFVLFVYFCFAFVRLKFCCKKNK